MDGVAEGEVKGLRWAQGQGEHGHGTKYHLVVEDVYREFDERGHGYGYPLQKTACGHYLLQSCDMPLGSWQEIYLDNGAPAWAVCPKCKAIYLESGGVLNQEAAL